MSAEAAIDVSGRVNSHPAAALFPLMVGPDLAALVESIRHFGLFEPIVLHEGLVLDGRNRLRACELAGVEPRFEEWQANGVSPTEWVVVKNLDRRHLTTAQRAALALDLLPHLEAESHERQRGGQGGILLPPQTEEAKGEATEKAARLVGVGRTAVADAKAIQKRDPEVIDRMRAGEIATVAAAAREVGLSRGRGDEAVASGGTDAAGRMKPVYYGKGDKFDEAVTPALRYFRAWRSRDFRFGHLNYKEARKRLAALEELAADIENAKADLAQRSEPARLRL